MSRPTNQRIALAVAVEALGGPDPVLNASVATYRPFKEIAAGFTAAGAALVGRGR